MVKVLTTDKPAELMNKQIKMVGATFDELTKVHESITKVAEMQEEHAKLLKELAALLGLNVKDEENLIEESRIVRV